MINVSIVATTLPFLHRVLAGLHTGILDTTLLTDHLDISSPGPSYISDPFQMTAEPCMNASEKSKGSSKKNRKGFRAASLLLRPRLTAEIKSMAVHEPRELAHNRPEVHPEIENMGDLTRNEHEAMAQTGIVQTWEVKVESTSRLPIT